MFHLTRKLKLTGIRDRGRVFATMSQPFSHLVHAGASAIWAWHHLSQPSSWTPAGKGFTDAEHMGSEIDSDYWTGDSEF